MTVSEVLGKYRRGRTLREYAEVLGISQSYLSQLLSGTRNAGNDVTRGFLRAFPEASAEYMAAFTASNHDDPALRAEARS